MSKFKVGDRVRIKYYCTSCDEGEICTLKMGTKNGTCMNELYAWGKESGANCACVNNWELVTNKINMNLKEKFATLFKSEPEKTFRKTGITNGDDLLTEEGQQVFLSYLLKKHGAEFKTEVVDELVKEDKA